MVADQQDLVRHGATQIIQSEPDLLVCGEAASNKEALEVLQIMQPDLVLADITLKESNGLELAKAVRASHPSILVIIMSLNPEEIWAEVAIRSGASGYLHKENCRRNLIPAIRTVLNGNIWLSPGVSDHLLKQTLRHYSSEEKASSLGNLSDRELQVLQMLGCWKTNNQIASELSISVKTVEYYRERIKDKFEIKSGTRLSQFAFELKEKGAI